MKEIGEKLREARESKGLTLQEISEQTKIRLVYLQAIENGDFDKLPGKVYVKGFIRSYATMVEIDPNEVLQPYRELIEQQVDEEEPDLSEVTVIRSNGPKSLGKYLIIIFILAILIAGFFFAKSIWITIKNETIPQLLESEEESHLAGQQLSDLQDPLAALDNDSDRQVIDSDQEPLNQDLNQNTSTDEDNSSTDGDNMDLEQKPVDTTAKDQNIESGHEKEPTVSGDTDPTDSPANNLPQDTEDELTNTSTQNKEGESANSSALEEESSNTDLTHEDQDKITDTSVQVNVDQSLTDTDDSSATREELDEVDLNSATDDPADMRDEERWQLYNPANNSSTISKIEPVVEAEKSQLLINASDESWIRVSADGEIVFQGIIEEGESKLFAGWTITLRIANAAAITVNYQGLTLGPFGAKDQLVEKVFGE